MGTKLRPYQDEGFEAINELWEQHDLLMFVLATGGGKTVTFVELIKKLLLEGKRIMLVAHREELILQAWNTLYRNQIFAGVIMAGHPEKFDLPVQVCSIQTVARRQHLPPADVLIYDEGHHATRENSYGKMIARYPSAKVLLVTATPYRLSGEGFEYLHPYKPTQLIINRTLKELTDEGWLVPLKYYAASIPDLQNIRLNKGDYDEDEARKAMELAPLVDSYFEHAKGKQGICFTVNVAHSIQTVQQYLYAGVPAEHLDANTKKEERQRILSDFRAGLVKIVSNVGILTEGSDFPNCEFVQLARPTKSLNLYLQMVGRNTRMDGSIVEAVNGAKSAEARKSLIARSKKPFGVILDNAGCWIDHYLPDHEHDWNMYFKGTKKQKKQALEEMEMLVYIAEDEKGHKIRTSKPEEIEGLKLVEITKERAKKRISITSIKEFDRLYALFKKMNKVKKPGYMAFNRFFDHCKKNQILLVDEIWIYLKKVLVDDIEAKIAQLQENRLKFPNSYPENQYQQLLQNIRMQGVSLSYLKGERSKYEKENQDDVLAYRFGLTG